MGTWVKETDKAIYLMKGGTYIAKVDKRPSTTNSKEYVVDAGAMRSWFLRSDAPGAMTVSVGIGAAEPAPEGGTPPPPDPNPTPTLDPDDDLPPSSHQGMQLQITTTTFFKTEPKMSSELKDNEKVLVNNGQIFDIEYYNDVGGNHWQIELLNPTVGDKKTTSWYVFTPDTSLLTNMSLAVISDTLFKAKPKMSGELAESEKVFVKNGTTFQLLSSEPAEGDHIKVELADANLGPNLASTWYVYQPDTKLSGQRQTLTVVSDTLFKLKPEQSSKLADSEKVFVKNGTTFLVNSYANPENNHVRVALQGAFLGPSNLTTWYAYVPDIEISGTEIGNSPNDDNPSTGQPAMPADPGIALTLPGYSGTYYSNHPIYWTTQYGEQGNFTWGEALHVNTSTGSYRPPANSSVVDGILKVARVMEDIRKMYGDVPIQINSWYRDPATNAAVGGASQSRHLSGDAVDFVVPGVSCFDVFARLDPWWGNKGGLASSSVFTHIDVRGYRARWDYGY